VRSVTDARGKEPEVAVGVLKQGQIWAPPPDRPARLAVSVTEQLLRRIAFGEFPPGAHLPTETNLATQFKVSRPVVREAVRSLEDKGVLSARQGIGTVVSERSQWSLFDPLVISARLETEPTTKLFRDLADVRLAIECQLARAAALAAPPAVLEALSLAVEEQDKVPISDPRYTDLDLQFHYLVAEASDNQVGRGIMAMLTPALRAMRGLTNKIPDASSHTKQWHRRILERISERDPEGASQAMLKHLSWSRDHFLSLEQASHKGTRK
jgi:DNA-binding FadR family transcriptional regulator